MSDDKTVFRFRRDDGSVVEIVRDDLVFGHRVDPVVLLEKFSNLATVLIDLKSEWYQKAALADAKYRRWRGEYQNELSEEPKMSEWKAKAKVEGSSMFEDHKRLIAKLESEYQWFSDQAMAMHQNKKLVEAIIKTVPGGIS